MPFKIACPGCAKVLQVPDAVAGKRAKCPTCEQTFLVPQPPAASAPANPTASWFDEAMKDPFPAAKPAATPDRQDAAPQPIETAGAWRDGRQLVVAIRGARFPPVCVKTGAPLSGRTTALELIWLPNQLFYFLVAGWIGVMIARKIRGERVTLDIPIKSDWLRRQRRARFLGWSLVAGGIAWAILTVLIWLAVLSATAGSPGGETRTELMLFIMILGPVLALAGFVYLGVRYGSILTVRNRLGDYVWIAGAHRKFLERLPTWDR